MPYDYDTMAKNQKKAGYVKIRPGETVIRHLPPTTRFLHEDITFAGYKYFLHYGVPVGDGREIVICPKTKDPDDLFKNPCPICDLARELREKGDAESKNEANAISRKEKTIFNVLCQDSNGEWQVMILDANYTIATGIMEYVADTEYIAGDLDNGRDLTIILTPGSSPRYNKYEVKPKPNASSVRDRLPEDWEERLDLLVDRIPEPPSYEEISHMLGFGSAAPKQAARAADTAFVDTTPQKVEPAAQKPVEEVGVKNDTTDSASTKPDCFGNGEEIAPNSEKCQACTFRKACLTEIMNG